MIIIWCACVCVCMCEQNLEGHLVCAVVVVVGFYVSPFDIWVGGLRE